MQNKIIVVPKGTFPHDILAAMGNRLEKIHVFFDEPMYLKFFDTSDEIVDLKNLCKFRRGTTTVWVKASDKAIPNKLISYQSETYKFYCPPIRPEEILLLEIEK